MMSVLRTWRDRRAEERRFHEALSLEYARLLVERERRRRLWYAGRGSYPGPYLRDELRAGAR